MVRQGRDVEDLLRDVLGGQRSGAAVELVGSVLVALGADQGEFGFGHAGGNVGDPNARAQQVAAQVVAELLDECLGGAVDVAARIRPVAGNRADADDACAFARFDQARQERVGDVDQPRHVGIDHGVPVAQVDLLRRLRGERQACVVDQCLDLAEACGQLGNHLLHRLGVTYVERGDVHRDLGRQFLLQRFESLLAAPGQDERPAGLGKAAGSGSAEAGCCTRDENHVVHAGTSCLLGRPYAADSGSLLRQAAKISSLLPPTAGAGRLRVLIGEYGG